MANRLLVDDFEIAAKSLLKMPLVIITENILSASEQFLDLGIGFGNELDN